MRENRSVILKGLAVLRINPELLVLNGLRVMCEKKEVRGKWQGTRGKGYGSRMSGGSFLILFPA